MHTQGRYEGPNTKIFFRQRKINFFEHYILNLRVFFKRLK